MKQKLESLCDVSTQILCLSATPPLIRTGRVVRCEDEELALELADPEPGFREGLHVVLAGGEETPFRILGVVSGVEGRRLRVKAERVVDVDKRDFPRLQGGIALRYRRLDDEAEGKDAAEAWIAGGGLPAGGEWWEPDPFMDFSGSGLRFQDRLSCSAGDLLLLEMQVPPSGNRWRATARVVRLTPIHHGDETQPGDGGEGEATHHIAVTFEHIPHEAAEALAACALRIQDALLKI